MPVGLVNGKHQSNLRPLLSGATVVTQILVMLFIFQRFLGVPTTTTRDRFIEGIATPDIQ
jgi:hypothetical protein